MTPRYEVSPAAVRDLDDQARYLAQVAGIETAIRFQQSAERTFRDLARMPGLGEPRASAHPRLAGLRIRRVDGFPNHLAFYRPTTEGIEVVRILHGARDVDRILEADA